MPLDKKAECVRRVGNWSKIEPKHKFDKKTFSKKETLSDMPNASPKMEALFRKIKELDDKDMKEDGHLYKHMIYSDIRAFGYGAKIIAASFIARGFNMAYGKDMHISEAALSKTPNNNFAILCSTPLYDKPLTVKLKQSVLQTFNSRPDNVHGKNLRFLILDQGYKEGIDVFDIKYIHLFEPTITLADERQAIGRGTRMCGQKGLSFNNEKGWPLYVYRYNSLLPKDPLYKNLPTIHELFLDISGFDLRTFNLASELDKMCIIGAVDHDLTEDLHSFSKTASSKIFVLPKNVKDYLMREDPSEVSRSATPTHMPLTPKKVMMYGREYYKGERIRCKEGCMGVIPVPTQLMQLAWIVAVDNDLAPLRMKRSRAFLCKELQNIKNKKYCKVLNEAWHNPSYFIRTNIEVIKAKLLTVLGENYVYSTNISDIANYITQEMEEAAKNEPPPHVPLHIPPNKKLKFGGMRRYINAEFGDYKWESVKLENQCPLKGGSSIAELNPSQNFVKDYFQPSNPYKGMLIYHGVGSGKTCAAIATATNSFEMSGYTILWVTRHTLKSDVWKNMFDQVCSMVISEKIRSGVKIPNTLAERKRMLSSNWLEPISYKQFSNFLKGRNKKLSDVIITRNGTVDPLRKTLVIIDEAHKLYAPDVVGSEKPDVDMLRKMIHSSYKKSGSDSARVLLMTATPYTADPLDLIRLLNFLREDHEQLPDTMETFSKMYLDNTGNFTTDGTVRFLEEITGYISYLNRENDIRQFAYPIISDVFVPISRVVPTQGLVKKINDLEDDIEDVENTITDHIPTTLKYMKDNYNDYKEKCMEIKDKKARDKCKKDHADKYNKDRDEINEQKKMFADARRDLKKSLTVAKKELEKAKKNDTSQEKVLRTDCLKVSS